MSERKNQTMIKFYLVNILLFALIVKSCYGQEQIIKSKKTYKIDNTEQFTLVILESNLKSLSSLPKIITYERQYNLDGKTIKEITYNNESINHVATYKYNDLGNRTEWLGESKTLKFKWVYYHNSKGENFKDEKYHGAELVLTYEYDFENNKIKTKRFINSIGKNIWTNHYTYDSLGRKLSLRMTHIIKEQEELTKYAYDDNDNLLIQEMYDYTNGLRWKISNSYDKSNNKIESIRFDENNEFVKKSFFKYNNHNDLIELKTYDKDNHQLEYSQYLRDYDINGNETVKIYIKDNIINSIEIYEIEYY